MTPQEINENVAIKLGAKRIVPEGHVCDDHYCDHWELPHEWNYRKYCKSLPDYCHSIEAAWEVVEYAKDFYFGLKSVGYLDIKNGGPIRKYEASFAKFDPDKPWGVCCESETAPMAICLAFLKLP